MPRHPKPKVLSDIQREGASVFQSIHGRLNLTRRNTLRIPLTRSIKIACAFFAVWTMLGGSVAAPTASFAANTTSNPTEERQALEAQLKALESQMDTYQDQIVSYQSQGKNLKNEIAKLNAKIASLSLEVKAVNLSLIQLNSKIQDTETKIGGIESNIEDQKASLAGLLRNLYQGDRVSMIEVFLKSPRFSDFFSDMNNIELLQSNVRATIRQITYLRDDLQDQKEQLTLARADAVTVKQYKESQKIEVDGLKGEKNTLLEVTKGQESKYQSLLTLTKKTAAEIRSRIFQLLGGGELSFEQAYNFAKLAGDATGVRPAFILAVLDRESALGQNVGRCKYNEIVPLTGKVAMHPTRDTPAFLELMKRLNIDPTSVMISCPNADGTYGGAMGPAQFIPSTWKMYADKVSQVTGHKPGNPWNSADAFVAAALYLKDSGADKNERNAAARYYCGGNWNRYVCTQIYGKKVVDRAAQFADDIKEITG